MIQNKINIFYYFTIFFNLLWLNKLIDDNRAFLWLSGWFNCVEITGLTGSGGGNGGGGGVVKDDWFTATMINK